MKVSNCQIFVTLYKFILNQQPVTQILAIWRKVCQIWRVSNKAGKMLANLKLCTQTVVQNVFWNLDWYFLKNRSSTKMTCDFWKMIVEVQQNNFNDIREHKVLVKDHFRSGWPCGWPSALGSMCCGTYPWHGLFSNFFNF